MVYYKAKKDMQSIYTHDTSKCITIVKDELFTTSEMQKNKLPFDLFDVVEINKRDVIWFFGARFEVKKEPKADIEYIIQVRD